jgi:Na+-transporting NADH:ubiquinone oxidoreductase subunit A
VAVHRFKKGLDLPMAGVPALTPIEAGPEISRVAALGDDTAGVRARLAVQEGDTVKRGQLLFEDRVRPGIRYTSPGAGRVQAVFRGARRSLRSVVIQLSEGERSGQPGDDEFAAFESFPGGDSKGWTPEQIRTLLIESGLWTALRTRPYSKVPEPDSTPFGLFITAMDTNPQAPDPEIVVAEYRDDFQRGLRMLSKLCEGTTWLCVKDGSEIAEGVDADLDLEVESFKGPHPAGLPGVHIHTLAPASRNRTLWHIGYADVIAVGQLAQTGRLPVERVITLGGPPVSRPRTIRTRLGASLDELTYGEIDESVGEVRIISGSVLSGKKAMGPEFGFLGRYHLQVSALRAGGREFLGWIEPGANKFSVLPVFLSKLLRKKEFDFTTDTNGSERALMPIGTYERVMPMDIIATYLLRSLLVGDIEQAEALGALELDEEDLALCTFVCPGKTEFGPYLRKNLERIEKEG